MNGPDTAGRDDDDDGIWRDIVARLDSPAETDEDGEAAPWPPEEAGHSQSFRVRVIKPADPDAVPSAPDTLPPGDDDEHYVPPPPPPLPKLDPIAKGAWIALFGGPAYLFATTIAGWTVASWAAFCAVAAFVGGFITLVVRMSGGDGDDSGSDDGAVV